MSSADNNNNNDGQEMLGVVPNDTGNNVNPEVKKEPATAALTADKPDATSTVYDHSDGDGTAPATCIELANCSVHPVGRNAPLVDDITMHVGVGEIFAILGPSGCGKSTLFSLLSHRLRNVDDWCVYAKTFNIPKHVVLVPQHDVFFPHDTPLRALSFIYQKAKLCSDQEAEAEAHTVLALVGLDSPDKYNTKIGEAGYDSPFSGGERRLLAVGRALMTHPDAILLDEPTTGLDAWTALDLVRKIKDVAQRSGTAVIFTVHQPSDALVHEFGTNVLRLTPPLPKEEPKGLEKFTYPPLTNHHTFVGWFFLLYLLIRRTAIRRVVDLTAMPLRLAFSVSIGLLLGVAFVDLPYDDARYIPDVIGLCLGVTATTFAPIVFASTLFPAEKAHFMDENPLRDTRYLIADGLARFLNDIFFSAASSAVALVACPIIGIEDVGTYFVTLWFQAWASDAFGFIISTLAPPHISIGTLIPTLGFISMAIGTGLMAPRKEDEGWIYHVAKWASFFKYGASGFMLQELPRVKTNCLTCPYPNGEAVLQELELVGDEFIKTQEFQWMMLIIVAVVLRFGSMITVRHLVSTGAAHYYYTPSSAGAAFKEANMEESEHHGQKDKKKDDEDDVNTPHYRFEIGDIIEGFHPKHYAPKAPPKKLVLKGRNVNIRQSTFTAVLGPTGCGKSVLLQAMTARLGAGLANPPDSPMIFGPNAKAINVQFDDGRDGFMKHLSVLEATVHGARLHFPTMSEEELEAHVMVHLTAFGLAPKAKDSVHKLSGGESKRLQVVTKLVTLPEILVLDEPTSGLDSNAAQALLKHLSHMSHVGIEGKPITIICSLKQPESRNIDNFDHFLFLDHDGEVLVQGNAAACQKYFNISEEHEELWADAALLSIHGQDVENLLVEGVNSRSKQENNPFTEEANKNKEEHPNEPTNDDTVFKNENNAAAPDANTTGTEEPTTDAEKKDADDKIAVVSDSNNNDQLQKQTLSTEHLNFARAISILTKRNFEQRWQRDPLGTLSVFAIRYLLIPVILSILLWRVGDNDPFFKNRMSLLFVVTGSHVFTTLISTAVVFPLERNVIEGEILSNYYSPMAYLFMQWFTLPFIEDVVGVCLVCIIAKFCTGLNIAFGWFFLSTLMLSQAAVGIGTMLGLFRSIVVASGFSVATLLPMMFATGVMVTTRQMERTGIFRVMEATSLTRFAFLIQFDSELNQSDNAKPFWGAYGFDNPSEWYRIDLAWALLCVYTVIIRVMALIVFNRNFRLALPTEKK